LRERGARGVRDKKARLLQRFRIRRLYPYQPTERAIITSVLAIGIRGSCRETNATIIRISLLARERARRGLGGEEKLAACTEVE
jgi:hypothetical protein